MAAAPRTSVALLSRLAGVLGVPQQIGWPAAASSSFTSWSRCAPTHGQRVRMLRPQISYRVLPAGASGPTLGSGTRSRPA